MTHIGGRIRNLRHERQMTLPALADRASISKGLLSKLENSPQSNPSLETLQKIAKALSVTLSDILESGEVQIRRVVPDVPPPWRDTLTKMLKLEGTEPDDDILQALYVLQSRKGNAQRDASAWLHMYKSLELSFASINK